jgi:hypothetical protein
MVPDRTDHVLLSPSLAGSLVFYDSTVLTGVAKLGSKMRSSNHVTLTSEPCKSYNPFPQGNAVNP